VFWGEWGAGGNFHIVVTKKNQMWKSPYLNLCIPGCQNIGGFLKFCTFLFGL
jgi:hypothetical protein